MEDQVIYFAADEADKAVNYLNNKSTDWFQSITYNNYMDRIKRSFDAYHGNYFEQAHTISFGGEQGELVNLAINHYRNIADHMLNMVTSTRPAFQCRAVNTDRRSQIQASLGNGLLDYYMRERRLERYLKRATQYAIVLSAGYIKMEWDATKGEIYDYVEPSEENITSYDEDENPLDENGRILKPIPVYQGDVTFKVLSPFDILFDSTKENYEDNEWILSRSFVNRFSLSAKYPELKSEILKVETKDKKQGRILSTTPYDETEDIAVYEFYHKKTEAVPEGRYILYVSDEAVLEDTILPYKDIPIYRISATDILGTGFGYTSMFDLLGIQDAINTLYSTAFTNQSTFGVQNIVSPIGSNVKMNQISSGMTHIEYNPIQGAPNGGAPQPLNLTNTPAEIFNFMQMLEKAMETISGMNSVVRGNADQASNLRSGNALALVQSQALQFISGLQQSYIQMIEDVGTGLINLLKTFANAPRVASIVGTSNTVKLKEFSSKDIQDVNRVVVDVGNALTQTSAGRLEIANNLLQQGLINSAEKYISVLTTGNLDVLIENEFNENLLIKDENERLINGEEIIAIALDKHDLHIREHRAVLSSQEMRRDQDLVERTLAHIQEHIDLLKNTDPALIQLIREQPLAPPQGPPQGPPAPEAAPPGSEQMMANPEAQSVAVADQMQGLPTPAGDPNQPVTAEQAFANQATGAMPQPM
jgi:hypothetical protein